MQRRSLPRREGFSPRDRAFCSQGRSSVNRQVSWRQVV
jgi:hypothetical protein